MCCMVHRDRTLGIIHQFMDLYVSNMHFMVVGDLLEGNVLPFASTKKETGRSGVMLLAWHTSHADQLIMETCNYFELYTCK